MEETIHNDKIKQGMSFPSIQKLFPMAAQFGVSFANQVNDSDVECAKSIALNSWPQETELLVVKRYKKQVKVIINRKS